MSLPPKMHISRWNNIPWLKLTNFIGHRNPPSPWTTLMGSVVSSHLPKISLCFCRKKKKIIGKHKLEKTEYHSRAWLYPGSKHNHTSHGLSLLDRKMTRIMFCLVCFFCFFL